MKKILLSAILNCLFISVSAQEILVKGVYRGRDVFVQNPYLGVEGSFCITAILVNGVTTAEEPSTSAVKVDLSKFLIDDTVAIQVLHHESCLPRILNPEVLNSGSMFEYIQLTADNASISWVTTGEKPGDGNYVLEKLKLDGWLPIAKVAGKGNLDNNQYSIGVDHYAGDNKFRLLYTYDGENEVVSDEFSFYSDMEPITYYPEDKIYDLISLSRPTDYVIKDFEGNILLKGIGQDINVESLPYGELILILENSPENFFRPQPEVIIRPKKKKGKKNR